MHLTPDELIDLAEGGQGRGARAAPAVVRDVPAAEVAALRAAMASAASVDVPEPSPLFWDHLSQRVREAIAAEGPSGSRLADGRWHGVRSWSVGCAIAGVAAAVVIAIYRDGAARLVAARRRYAGRDAGGHGGGVRAAAVWRRRRSIVDPRGRPDASSWIRMRSPKPDGASHAGASTKSVANLTDDERLELHRLLKEALEKSGRVMTRFVMVLRSSYSPPSPAAGHTAAPGQGRGAPIGRRRRRGGADDPGVTPAEIQRMFDAYALVQAQDQLQLTRRSVRAFSRALQDRCRTSAGDRSRSTRALIADLRRMLTPAARQPDEARDSRAAPDARRHRSARRHRRRARRTKASIRCST